MSAGSAKRRHPHRVAVILLRTGTLCLAAWSVLLATRALTWELAPSVHVRWRSGLSDAERRTLENRFLLVNAQRTEGTTWAYDLLDVSETNIRELVQQPAVADTGEIDPYRFRVSQDAPPGHTERWMIHRFPIARASWIRDRLLEVVLATALLFLLCAFLLGRTRHAA